MTFFQCERCLKIFEWTTIEVDACPNCNEKCTFTDVTNYTDECGGPGNIDQQLVKK